MNIYFAGADTEQVREILHDAGVKKILMSYYTLTCYGTKKTFQNNNLPAWIDSFLLDSGGFSARIHGYSIKVEDLATFINFNNIKLAFNLDVGTPEEQLANQEFLEKHTNAYIIPIYHQTEWIKSKSRPYLDYYIAKYPYISLGGLAGNENPETMVRFLRNVFNKTRNKTRVHLLGVTNEKLLVEYPAYSSDSTRWLAPGRYGAEFCTKNKKMAEVRRKTLSYKIREQQGAGKTLELEDKITRLWKARGVEWNTLAPEELIKLRKDELTYEQWCKTRQ